MGDELVQLDEVRVSKRRDRAELALEPELRFVVRDAANLDRDVHLAPEIAPQIDNAHAAPTELAHDLVAITDESSDTLGH